MFKLDEVVEITPKSDEGKAAFQEWLDASLIKHKALKWHAVESVVTGSAQVRGVWYALSDLTAVPLDQPEYKIQFDRYNFSIARLTSRIKGKLPTGAVRYKPVAYFPTIRALKEYAITYCIRVHGAEQAADTEAHFRQILKACEAPEEANYGD